MTSKAPFLACVSFTAHRLSQATTQESQIQNVALQPLLWSIPNCFPNHKVLLVPLATINGWSRVLGSPEQEAVGEFEESHLMPATACFHGVTQQDSVEVGIHGFRERLELFVEESPGARNQGVRG